MRNKYRLTPNAAADIDEIAAYTLDTWGQQQTRKYISELEKRFVWLAQQPTAGRDRDDIRLGLRSYLQGSHVVIYRVVGSDIEVVAVPHQSQDIKKHLGPVK